MTLLLLSSRKDFEWRPSDLGRQSDKVRQSHMSCHSDVGCQSHVSRQSQVGLQSHVGLKSHVGRQSRVGLQSHVGRQSRVGCQTHVPPEATASRSLRPTQRSQSPGHFGSSVFSVGLYYATTVLDSAETFCRLLIDFRDRRDIRRMVFALCPICTVRVCVAPTDTVSVLRGSLNIEFRVSLRCPELC